ncbi:MAG: hypothetical protein U0360_01625 [Dehalococcoidia bacterium]
MARAAEVDAYFDGLAHPLKSTMEAVRREILAADGRMTESIKWKSPTFEQVVAQLRAGATSRASTRGRNSS